MNIEKKLRTALLAMSAVTDLVVARVWDEWFRTETVPAIVYEFGDEDIENDLSGKGDCVIADVLITCRANTREASRALADAVRLNGTSPSTGLAGYTSTGFDSWLESQGSEAVQRGEGSNAYWYDTTMNFVLKWTEGT